MSTTPFRPSCPEKVFNYRLENRYSIMPKMVEDDRHLEMIDLVSACFTLQNGGTTDGICLERPVP